MGKKRPGTLKVTVCHTAGHYGEEYDDRNSAVLRSRRNCSSNGAERTDDGRAFHTRAAVTGKARSPSVVRRVDGKKGKVFPYSLASVGPRADPGTGSQPAGDV